MIRVVMSPKPKHEVSWLTTDVDIGYPLMSYSERTVHHLMKGSQLDIGLDSLIGPGFGGLLAALTENRQPLAGGLM